MQLTDSDLSLVHAHHLFTGLAPPQLQRILAASGAEQFDAGQVLFDRGQPAQHFFMVFEGQVNLVLYSKAGEEKLVEILSPGQSFAEAVMFMSGTAYPVTAIATMDTRVGRFSNREYIALLRESPDTCLRMLGGLSQRLHMRLREIEQLTLESATHRLVYLIDNRLPLESTGPATLTLKESRQELASRLAMKPETLSRILRQLSDAGLIEVHGRDVTVPNRRRLIAILDTDE